jgi:hypothetical protein
VLIITSNRCSLLSCRVPLIANYRTARLHSYADSQLAVHTMALPLHSFMKDLLTDSSDHSMVSIVVDNAKSRSPRISLGIGSDQDLFQRRIGRKHLGRRDTLDVSDHSKKESRWETSSLHQNLRPQPPATPMTPEPGTFGSPTFTGTKRAGSSRISPTKEKTRYSTSTDRKNNHQHEVSSPEFVDQALHICDVKEPV